MTPQELKNSILKLAIQGKLVEQRPEEGTGEELYAKLCLDRDYLVQQKKFKGKKYPKLTEEELPFDIPDTWKWARLGDVISIESGKGLTAAQMMEGTVPVYGGNGITGYHNESLIHEETVVIGRVGFYCGSVQITEQESWVTDNAFITTYPQDSIDRKFLVYMLRHMNLGRDNNATAQPVVSGKKIYPLAFPLPPFAEQKRIVDKIEELLPYIDRYEQAWSKLEDFNKRFPDDMQKSILQMAIEGKLVEQRSEEGTGEELYQLILAEKQRLIKAGAIRKEKPLSDINEDEVPFEIPGSWVWAKLGTLFAIERGSSPRPIKAYLTTSEDGVNWIKIGDSEAGAKYIKSTSEKITREGAKKSRLVNVGDFIISNSMSFGRPYIMAINGYVHDGWNIIHIIKLENELEFNKDYLYYVLSSNLLVEQMRDKAAGGVVKNIRSDCLRELIIPIPPLDEQKRIVAKLEEILPLYEKLKTH